MVIQGALSPEGIQVNVTPGAMSLDLTTVTAAQIKVRRPDGTTAFWSATLSNQTPTTLTLTHLFLSGDVDQIGNWWAVAYLTVPGGTERTISQPFQVGPEFPSS